MDPTDIPKSAEHSRSDVAHRAELASLVPFFLRTWWLRDRVGNEDLFTFDFDYGTLPLFALHSDPICDTGSSDAASL